MRAAAGRRDAELRAAAALIVGVGEPDDELVGRQVSAGERVVVGLLRGGGHRDRGGDPDREAGRRQRGAGAGLVAGQIAQRQAHRDRRATGESGQRPDSERSQQQHSGRGRQDADHDQQGVHARGPGSAPTNPAAASTVPSRAKRWAGCGGAGRPDSASTIGRRATARAGHHDAASALRMARITLAITAHQGSAKRVVAMPDELFESRGQRQPRHQPERPRRRPRRRGRPLRRWPA